MKTYGGSESVAKLNHSTRCCVSFKLRSLYHHKLPPVLTGDKTVRAPEPIWTWWQNEKSAPVTGVERPSSSQTPGH
jgi:hypothetical protein